MFPVEGSLERLLERFVFGRSSRRSGLLSNKTS